MKKFKELDKGKLQDIFVSVVVVIGPKSERLDKSVTALFRLLRAHYTNYEIVIVDNGAPADEFEAAASLLGEVPCIRIIKLSQHFSYDTAVFAGLEISVGDYVCTVDFITDSPKDIPDFVKKNQTYDVVQGVSAIPIHGVFGSQMGRKLFYWYNRKYIGIDIPLNSTYYASYSRRAINSLTSSTRNHRHIRHLARKIGFGYIPHVYTPIRNPSNQRRLRTSVVEALEIVTSYSTHPLRFVTWLGFFAGGVNILYAIYVVVLNIADSKLAPGWTSTSMQLSLMFFVLFVIMIIVSEYIGRILSESHQDPHYFVADELVSTVAIADTKRRNISK